MRSRTYLILAIFSVIGLFAAAGLFIYRMVTSELTEVSELLMTIGLYVGSVVTFMLLIAYFMIKFVGSMASSSVIANTKRCVSCGMMISITDLSCPRCFAIQPPEDHGAFPRKR
jgi:hypothetical protein